MPGQRKKILFTVTKSVWGGAQKYVFEMASSLPWDQYDAAVALGGNGPLAEKLREAKLRVHRVNNFDRNVLLFKDFLAGFEVLRILLKERPDAVHANSPKAAGITGAAIALYKILTFFRRPVRTVYTVHGWTSEEPWRPRWHKFLIRAFSRITCRFYDSIILISTHDQKTALAFRIVPKRKISLIPNGIQDISFLERIEAKNMLLGKPSRAPVIGSIGEWTQNKGFHVLIQAFKKIIKNVPDATLILIGWGEEEPKLRERVRKLDLGGSVVFKDNIQGAARYIKAFDVFVLPSVKEGLPYVILEAGLAKVPVIATCVGGIPDIIRNNQDGILVNPSSSDELCEAVIQLIREYKNAETMASSLAERVRNEFTFKKMLDRTIALYEPPTLRAR